MFAPPPPMLPPNPQVDALIDLALAEDLGCLDVTAATLIAPGTPARFEIRARESLVFCGAPVIERLLWRLGADAPQAHWHTPEGSRVEAGAVVGWIEGDQHLLLQVERTCLNFMQRMSGVATLSARYVAAVEGTSARIVDTRKTLPGWRVLDKYAVRCGGAFNHRFGLDGGVLIKDNHLEAAGGVAAAVARARAFAPHTLTIEVEVEDLEGVREALAAKADVILLDNFTPEALAEAAALIGAEAVIHASGGITLESVRAFALAGAQLISVGALTHSAVAVDLAAEVV